MIELHEAEYFERKEEMIHGKSKIRQHSNSIQLLTAPGYSFLI